jgi:hypothetical protein
MLGFPIFYYLSLEETKRRYPRIDEVFNTIGRIFQELDYLSGTLLGFGEAQAKTEHPFIEYRYAERKINREVKNDRVFPLETVEIQEFRTDHGFDLEEAIIHTGPYADELARSLNALAVTIGSEIYFRDKAYNPSSEEGREIIAHELTHVSQYERSEEYQNETKEKLEKEAEHEELREQYNFDPIITIVINRHRYSFPKSRLKHCAEMAADKVEDWMSKQKYALNEREYLDLLCAYDKWLGGI